ncbi:MAG: type III pantothenate kinase [Dehalococcoidales bacterium]|nr:type III pantothenate kinase [Dehalococcoidales bacterium]
MLLTIDIGNTRTNLGLFHKDELCASWAISSDLKKTSDEYGLMLTNFILSKKYNVSDVEDVCICSVVPMMTVIMQEVAKDYFKADPLVIASGVKTGVKIRLDNPKEVGADRIANAVSSHAIYKTAVIAVDLGTATTFDVVNEEGDYLGGAIAPGLDMAAESLASKTSLLPRVSFTDVPNAIGKSTVTAMQAGLLYGYIGLIEGITAKIKKELGVPCKVVATGGYAELLSQHTDIFDDINQGLTLEGIRMIYAMNR